MSLRGGAELMFLRSVISGRELFRVPSDLDLLRGSVKRGFSLKSTSSKGL